jgi:hypothetical protein
MGEEAELGKFRSVPTQRHRITTTNISNYGPVPQKCNNTIMTSQNLKVSDDGVL